jgi:hypothetical protein
MDSQPRLVTTPEGGPLRERIAQLARQMKAQLAIARATFQNTGNRGDEAEESLRSVLREYLPRRLEVGHGEVVDSHGGRSAQTDVVIANEDHPFTFSRDQPGLFFIEGVSAAGEVKAVLTAQNLSESLDKAVRFKSLRPLHIPAFGYVGEQDRNAFGANPPWFIFAFESQLGLEAIYATLRDKQESLEPNKRIADAVFCLDRGILIDVGEGTSPLAAVGADGSPVTGWVQSRTDQVLFEFVGWLSVSIPRVLLLQQILTRYLMPWKA